MAHPIPTIRGPAAARRALLGILTTFIGVAACDQQPAELPTSPSIPARAVPHATVVGASVTMLPTLGGASTWAADINDAGQVVGSSETGQVRHAFLWTTDGGMHDLGTLGGFHSDATAINAAGQVVGYADLEGSRVWHAFLWTPGKGMRDLGTLDGGTYSYARAIDDEGRVIGLSTSATGGATMFLWTPDRGMQDLSSLGVPGQVIDFNNAGQMAGTAMFDGEDHAFLWTPGEGTRDLGKLDGEFTIARAVNEAGWVVGFTKTDAPFERPFLWTPRDGMRNLGTLGGDRTSIAMDVNDLGQVVGRSRTTTSAQHAFLWTETHGMEDIFPMTGLTDVVAINNRGQVLGSDRVATLQFRAPNRDGGSTTGGGFYVVAGQASGKGSKAHFTFAADFFPGRTAPNGKAKFWIPGGRVDFESSTVEMLVVSGNRARFWGVGTLNGASARFRITAVDGTLTGTHGNADAFRIELWQSGTLVFDTQPGAAQDAAVTTPIDGGSIRIRAG